MSVFIVTSSPVYVNGIFDFFLQFSSRSRLSHLSQNTASLCSTCDCLLLIWVGDTIGVLVT